MTKQEFDEMAALVVRLRKQVEIEQARATHESRERHTLVLQLSAHVDALKQSNAQCGEYLLHNEMLAADRSTLHKELVEVRAALASVSEERDSLKRTLQEWEDAETEPHVRVAADDIADHVVPPLCFDCGSRLVNVGGLFDLCRSAECMKRTRPGAP